MRGQRYAMKNEIGPDGFTIAVLILTTGGPIGVGAVSESAAGKQPADSSAPRKPLVDTVIPHIGLPPFLC